MSLKIFYISERSNVYAFLCGHGEQGEIVLDGYLGIDTASLQIFPGNFGQV